MNIAYCILHITVHALNIPESTADLVVWVRIKWTDPRLMWDPAEFGGLTTAWFFLSDGMGGGESSEIWAPDMYLWNQEEDMSGTLADTYATVSSDGTVFWSRPGRIKSTCKYIGLENFPFDRLGCALEFGSWAHSGLYFRPVKLNGDGYTIGGSETAGGSYQEFFLIPDDVAVESIIYPPFPSSPEEDWPVLIYTLTFERASAPYVRGVVLINILLNFAAFACFWIPPHVGERMGLAITCVLAAVAGELVVAAMLPICQEMSWYTRFSIGSTTFALFVVFESTIVIFFFYFTGDDLMPTYIKYMKRKWKEQQIRRIEENARKEWEKDENRINGAGFDDTAAKKMDATKLEQSQSQQGDRSQRPLHTSNAGVRWKVGETVVFGCDGDGDGDSGDAGSDEIFEGDDGLPDDAQSEGILRNTAKSIGSLTSGCAINRATLGGNKNGIVSLRDSLAETKYDWMNERSLAVQLADAGDFKTKAEAANNTYWQVVSGYIDEGSRVVIPMMYCAFLGYIFHGTR